MTKVTRFQDIPKFVRDGAWECNYGMKSLIEFIQKEKKEGLNLDPDFQRPHVWNEDQQIKFIEFFMQGGRTGIVIYLNNPSWMGYVPKEGYNEYVLVDGKQRVRAVERFLNNEIKAFGSFFSEFTDKLPFADPTFKVNINTLQTRREVLQWYLDMNTGGVVHSDEEITKVKKLLEQEGRK